MHSVYPDKQCCSKNYKELKTKINPRSYGVFFVFMKRIPAIVLPLLLIYGCSEYDDVGLDLYHADGPFEVRMEAVDTLTLKAMTVPDDSLAMSLGATNILGVVNDPVFGKTRAGIYTETRLPMNNLSLGDRPVLDSIHLVLVHTGDYYGRLQDFQNIKVYELAENFPEQDTLYSNIEIPHTSVLLNKERDGHFIRPAPEDSVLVDSVLQPPQIRIPLSDSFGRKFINASGTYAFENVPGYLEAFKGLYIVPDEDIEGMGSMFTIDMLHVLSSIELYFHNEGDTVGSRVRFPVNEFAKRATAVTHFGYENAHESLRRQVFDLDQTVADSLLFVQSMGVTRVDIQIPFLQEIADTPKLLINKAELVFPIAEGFSTEELPASNDLLLLRIDKDEKDLFLLDDFRIGRDYFGGMLSADETRYTFNITQYFQQVMDGHLENDGLALIAGGSAQDMSRVVLNGPGRTNNPMRLVIYYSVFD